MYLDVNLVGAENHWNIFADTLKIAMPGRDILVGNFGGYVKHNDGTLTVDVVSITKATKLFLACGIPDIEVDKTGTC